jgi:hypothetical protein
MLKLLGGVTLNKLTDDLQEQLGSEAGASTGHATAITGGRERVGELLPEENV